VRVLLVTANYRPSVGGVERFVELLAEGLAARGHDVTVATCGPGGAPAEENQDGVRVVRIPASDVLRRRLDVPYPLPAPAACVRTLRNLVSRADVIHAQDALYLTTVAALAIANRRRVPSVLTQHVAFVPQRRRVLDAAQRAAISTLGRSSRRASVVVAYNPSVAEWARTVWRLRDVRVLPVGVEPPARRDREGVRRELGLAQNAFVALFTGRDVPKKRLDVFLAARDPSYELVAVTDRVADGVPAGVRLLPFMPPAEFRRLLGAADAFVLPSEGEGFPLALQEALVAGLPCLIAPHEGYRKLISEDDVVLVRPEPTAVREALLRLAANPDEARPLGERAAAAGRRAFSLDRFVDAYEDLYSGLAASGAEAR
jgi:glycosyltransferase involved in cell wall biosynthesis